ncbi:hypothetical protein DPMN_121028 [Dreissena polymorpha]|uniref:Uncharacterized protein n=1 Tax=Dreissena polymorpha TaxID=45954 RepID=A0A9D4GLE6_DREPO|nr:hypothetical protein DPMN_121028 [Dreissena polymorpha]
MDIARSAEGATYMATDSSDGVVLLREKPRMNVQQFFTKVKTRRDPDRSSAYLGSASAISGCSYIRLVEMEENKD